MKARFSNLTQVKLSKLLKDGVAIPPNFQRALCEEHVNKIKSSIDIDNFVFIGCIIIGTYSNKNIVLLDGNHRISALKSLFEDHGEKVFDPIINCNYIFLENEEEAEKYFNQINNCRAPHTLPETLEQSSVNRIITELRNRYRDTFRQTKTGKVQRPNISINECITMLSELQNKTKLDLNEFMTKVNDLEKRFREKALKNPLSMKSMSSDTMETMSKLIDKCRNQDCFLGLRPNAKWILEAYGFHNNQLKRGKISKIVINQLCVRDSKDGKNKCCFCNGDLNNSNISVDHIVPISKGGTDDISNLQLCCVSCNSSKGNREK